MGTFLDIHVHTNRYSSCSKLSPLAAVKQAAKKKIDGIVITEHDVMWEEDEVAELVDKAGNLDIIVLVGQELRGYREDGVPHGDMLAFGFDQKVEGLPPAHELIDMVHQAGGVVIAAHPYRKLLGFGDEVYEMEFDGIEVFNPKHLLLDTMKAERAWKELEIAGTGASDAHGKRLLGKFLTHFESKILCEEDLVNEIKARRCKPIKYDDAMQLRFKPV
jgi:predicted metal-dependent phosphoesterase TrpH